MPIRLFFFFFLDQGDTFKTKDPPLWIDLDRNKIAASFQICADVWGEF